MTVNLTPQKKIDIYKNLFKGRDNVFAVRWEKADKSASGYTPVCLNEWKPELCYKLQRKKCKDCPNQKYVSLNNYYIDQHLRGYNTYGIYPLLDDNTSYFLAVDFDKKKWQEDILKLYRKCKSYDLPIYMERSRSGNGAHAWLFFENKYPAYKSRNIAINILKEAKVIDLFEKEDSFDRLFPNQDALSGKGFGNLIALPLQGKSRKDNNTVFLNAEDNLRMFDNQWEILQKVKKISSDFLNKFYNKFNQNKTKNKQVIKSKSKNHLIITIKEQICISKTNLPRVLINYLRDNLNFVNSEFLIKKRMGISVYGVERYFKLIETSGDNFAIPRGFLSSLINFLDENDIKFKLVDERNKCKDIKFNSSCKLFGYQKKAVKDMLISENGILVAPSGAGKTIMGIDLISKLKQPVLILVHKKQIFDQWLDRIESFLNISRREIGQFCSNKKKMGSKVTVAMIQTLVRMDDFSEIYNKNNYGLILVDECHHVPARMFRNVITKFNPYYLYGFTATPIRKNNDEKLIFIYLGDILHTIENDFRTQKLNSKKSKLETKVIIRNTEIDIPFEVKIDNFQTLSKIIVFDSNRNKQITNDIIKEVNKGSKCLVLTERKEHVEVLSYYLKGECEIITLTGDLTERQRAEKLKQVDSGDFQILIATGQLIGEGTDFPKLDYLFLVYPFSFEGKLIQYIGRVQRGLSVGNSIYDYRDIRIKYLEKFFKKRLNYYKNNFNLKI